MDHVEDELGDLLFPSGVLQSIRKRRRVISIFTRCKSLVVEKLLRRHPSCFPSGHARESLT